MTDIADYLKDFIRLNANIRDMTVDSVPDQSHSSVEKLNEIAVSLKNQIG